MPKTIYNGPYKRSPILLAQTTLCTVLLPDDEPDLRELYTVFLEADYRALTAGSGDVSPEIIRDEIGVVLSHRTDRHSGDGASGSPGKLVTGAGRDDIRVVSTAVAPDTVISVPALNRV